MTYMAGARGRILIVEDEAKIAEVTRAYLERAGYAVTHAPTGKRAMSALSEPFDLLILDLMLPDMDGTEICRAVRKTSEVPIIMLTAKSGEEDRIGGLGLGADDYVTKPFSPRELVARVEAQLRRSRKLKPAGSTVSFNKGALTMNPETLEVRVAGKPVTLTPTEFKILQALAERPGVVLSRQQLVTIAQGYDFEGYERTIDAHVKNLRHKIEPEAGGTGGEGGLVFIKTVYGMGYKFTGERDEA